MAQVAVIGTVPVNNATSVPTATQLTINFSAAIDTTRDITQGNAYFANFDSVKGHEWTADRKSITLALGLKPDKVYFIIVYAVQPAAGGSLQVPSLTYFTTGSSFPSNMFTVSGTLASSNSGFTPDNAIVGLSLNSPQNAEPQFVSVGKSGADGSFSLPYVPDGTYYPVAAKDLNGDGAIDPQTGDGIALGDATVISGNTTGMNLVLQVPGLVSWAAARDSMPAYVSTRLPLNRQLRLAIARMVDSTGPAAQWEFYYYLPDSVKFRQFRYDSFGSAEENGVDQGTAFWLANTRPITDLHAAILPETLVPMLDAAGGYAFRQQGSREPQAEFRRAMTLGDLRNSQFSFMILDTTKIYWGVEYAFMKDVRKDSSAMFEYRRYVCNSLTGQILSTTGVAQEGSGLLPEHTSLMQNYPNPFNPSTTIGYTVASTGFGVSGLGSGVVKLSVYDMLGQEVAVLVNAPQQPGFHEVTFDGSRLASGTYIYRLVAGSFIQSNKMVILK